MAPLLSMAAVDVYVDEELPPGGWRFESLEQWRQRIDADLEQGDER